MPLHHTSLRQRSDYGPLTDGHAPDGGTPRAEREADPRARAEILAAGGAAALGVVAFVVSGAWRPTESSGDSVASPFGASVIVTRTILVVLLGASFLGLSVPTVRHAASRFVASGSYESRGVRWWQAVWARALSLPLVLLMAIVAWAAATGRPIASYALAYGAMLPLLTALVAAGPSPTTSPSTPRWPLGMLVCVALVLWLPVELSLLPHLPQIGTVAISAGKFVAFVTALWLFLVLRPLGAVGHGIAVAASEARTALFGFLGFAVVAVPVGLGIGFLSWNPLGDVALYLLRPILIFFTIALPEELVFRGIIQRALTQRWGFRIALAVTAITFGLAHAPSVPYMALAGLAGVAYGWVYERTGRVAAAALTHTLVDAVWVLLLRP